MARELKIEPLGVWPGSRTVVPTRAPFGSKYGSTMETLERELRMLAAQAVVLQMDVRPDQVRVDGYLKGNASPASAALILSFSSPKVGKVRFACDRFLHWQDNLRAIALGMESLRRVDRYGITSDGQQYAGFRALESSESARGFTSTEDAARFVLHLADDSFTDDRIESLVPSVIASDVVRDAFYRNAARVAHPDAGGSDELMARLNAARAMLEEA